MPRLSFASTPLIALACLATAMSCPAQTGLLPAGTKHLYLHCEGTRHGPAVILDSGLFRDSTDWHLVQPEVARFTQVCSYDREGLGQSTVDGLKPETECIDQQVNDLRFLLQAAGIPPPYLLAAHSAGGIRIRRYTRSYPAEVIGLVFVDSAHEEQIWRFQAIDPSSVQGPPADPVKARCGGALPTPGERLVWHTDLPLIALEHGIPLTFNGPLAAHTAAFNTALDDMAKDLAHRSSRGQLRIAHGSGHDIIFDEPMLVVQAIHHVWREVQRSAGPR